jgi:hypothetical protein
VCGLVRPNHVTKMRARNRSKVDHNLGNRATTHVGANNCRIEIVLPWDSRSLWSPPHGYDRSKC